MNQKKRGGFNEFWFNDDIIKDYTDLLSNAYPNTHTAYEGCFIPVLTLSKIKTKDDIGLQQICNGTHRVSRLDLKDRWIVPFSVDSVHWIVCIVMLKYHKIIIYDSMEDDNTGINSDLLFYVDKIRDFLTIYGTIHKLQDFVSIPWLTCVVPFHSVQTDKITCATQVLIAIHIATIMEQTMIPYDIKITKAMEIHMRLYEMYYSKKNRKNNSNQLSRRLDLIDVETLEKMGVITWKETCAKEYFQVSSALENDSQKDIQILHYPLQRIIVDGPLMDTMSAQDKLKQNLCVIAEKRNLYNKSQKKNYPEAYIRYCCLSRDIFGTMNFSSFLEIGSYILNFMMGDSVCASSTLDIFSLVGFDYNPLMLEIAIANECKKMAISPPRLELNFRRAIGNTKILLPFQDYPTEVILNTTEKYKNNIHTVINENDAMYCLKSVYGDVVINLWNDQLEWLADVDGPKKKRAIVCLSDFKGLDLYREIIQKKKMENLCIFVLLIIAEEDIMCIQTITHVSDGSIHKRRKNNDDEKMCSYEISKNLIYPKFREECIDRTWQKGNFTILRDPNIGRKKPRLLLF